MLPKGHACNGAGGWPREATWVAGQPLGLPVAGTYTRPECRGNTLETGWPRLHAVMRVCMHGAARPGGRTCCGRAVSDGRKRGHG